MFKKIIDNWYENKIKKQYLSGYNYAAGALLMGTKTPADLEAEQVWITDNECNNFDCGIESAILDAIDKKLVEDNRI